MKKIGFTFLITLLLLLTAFRALAFASPGADINAPEDISDVRISEVRIDQPSTDNDEYFELKGPAGQTLTGLTYLVIGDGTVGSGVIENVTSLTGQAIDPNGFFVVAESTFSLGTANLVATLNFENDDNVTHLLVADFTGSNGQDLDTNDDGVLDVTPWTSVVDLIAVIKSENPPVGTEWHYGPPTVGPDGSSVPGHVYVCTDGWEIGIFDPTVGEDTPGSANLCPIPGSELSVTKVGPLTSSAGQTIVYDIILANTGDVTATNVILTDTLPLNTTFVSNNIGAPANPTAGVYVWNLGELASAGNVTYQITVTIAPDAAEGEVLTNLVEVSTGEPGDTATGNSDTAVTTIFAPFTSSNVLTFNQIGRYAGSGAEIVDHDPISQTLYVVTGGPFMEILDITNPFTPTLNFTIPITPYGAGANSVAVYDGVVAAAVENITKTLPGKVVFFDRDGNYLNEVIVGALPDMLTYTPDGQKILVANEGEPDGDDDPQGSISVIDMSGGVMVATVTTLDFTHFTTDTIDPAVRIFPGKTVAEDVEPEYIAIAPDGLTAWVTLQEANAVAIVDMQAMTITQIVPLGWKDYSLPGNELDASDRDGAGGGPAINIANWPVYGMYMPDAIAAYEANGNIYLLTANEGDDRGETARVSSRTLDPTVFPNAATLQQNANLGRLNISTIDGDTDGDGDHDALYAYGARSFTIWNGGTGALVYDSGAELERATAVLTPDIFNYDEGDVTLFDTRSDNKGPEPEGVTKGVINGRTYAFVGLERAGGIMVYDVTEPTMPSYVHYITPVDTDNNDIADDISPEGLRFIPAADSPNGNPLLAVAYEVSGTTVLYEMTFTVTFVYHDVEDVVQPGEEIFIAGNFNGFNNNIDQLTPDATYDVFTITLSGLPTNITYKYVVDITGQKEWDWLNTSDRSVSLPGSTTLDDYRNVTVGYAVLSGPGILTTTTNVGVGPVLGQVYINNVTNPDGAPRGVMAQVGFGNNTDPATWTWTGATHVGQSGNNDIFDGNLTPTAAGVYSFTNRFNGNWGASNPNSVWTYGDLTGVGPYPGGEFSIADTGVLTVTEPDYCAIDPSHLIHEVQGSGASSPIIGQAVTVQAVVVSNFQGGPGTLNGFHIQEEDDNHDADPATSEGIFVFNSTPVSEGDLVHVAGNVAEFNGLTQLSSATVTVCSQDNVITPTLVTLPLDAGVTWERFEGMLIEMEDLTATDNFRLGRFGQVRLATHRLAQPTNVVLPGAPAIALQELNNRSYITLDDARTLQNVDPMVYPAPELTYTNTLRGGDQVAQVIGVIDHFTADSADDYRLQPTQPVNFTAVNVRQERPDVGGTIQVASFNVLNYFSTIDAGPDICGPLSNQDCRGADSALEFERQYTKIMNALVEIDAAVVGLMEIENHADDEAVIDLITRLNIVAGGVYTYVDTGVIGTDAIKQAIIYQPALVTPVGDYAILNSIVDPNFDDSRNRPVIIQTFEENSSGERFTVAVNHLKSKGSACAGDPDLGDGQGNCNLTRTAAAEALVDYLATDPTGSGSNHFLIIGDLNSYAMEDPIRAIETAGYTNLVSLFGGLNAYGYQFDGQWGYLDHGLASDDLLSFVTGAVEWHLNADEPIVFDYNTEFKTTRQIDIFFSPEPFRSSDHDPVMVGLNFAPQVTPTIDILTPTNGQVFTSTNGTAVSVPVTITTTDFTMPADGYWRVSVDGVLESGPVTDTTTTIALLPGEYEISVELYDAGGTALGIVDTVTVTVNVEYFLYLPVIMKP